MKGLITLIFLAISAACPAQKQSFVLFNQTDSTYVEITVDFPVQDTADKGAIKLFISAEELDYAGANRQYLVSGYHLYHTDSIYRERNDLSCSLSKKATHPALGIKSGETVSISLEKLKPWLELGYQCYIELEYIYFINSERKKVAIDNMKQYYFFHIDPFGRLPIISDQSP